jgi:hypothetical protein
VSENIYSPPLAQLETDVQRPSQFYVVSPAKLFTLATLTFGLYFYYWSFKNWSLYKRSTQEDIWPIARGMFCIFFIHKLYRRADQQIRDSGRKFDWDYEQWATVFVVLTIGANLLDAAAKRVDSFAFLAEWLLVVMPLRAYVVSRSQPMINFAVDDPEALSNSRYTAWNYVVIVLGVALWALALYGVWIIHN